MTAAKSTSLKSKEYCPGMVSTSRKTEWLVSSNSPRSVDDLSFTSRDPEGRIRWWDVTPPKTNYYHVHQMLGRAYAFEVLDLLNNPDAETPANGHELGSICEAIARWSCTGVQGEDGMVNGFFAVISEYVSTGTASR